MIYNLIVIGAGGTGTYFLKEVSRQISSDKSIQKKLSSLFIVDGDMVESKNLERQCFTSDDIGRNKAIVMAEVLNETFDLQWKALPEYFTTQKRLKEICETDSNAVPVIIGCVDNHACRLLCEQYFNASNNCVYFDAANEFATGECVYAYRIKDTLIGPPRSFYFPEIKEGDLRNVTEISCQELNAVLPQHIYTNMSSGLCLLSGFNNLMDGRLTPGVIYFNSQKLQMEFIPFFK